MFFVQPLRHLVGRARHVLHPPSTFLLFLFISPVQLAILNVAFPSSPSTLVAPTHHRSHIPPQTHYIHTHTTTTSHKLPLPHTAILAHHHSNTPPYPHTTTPTHHHTHQPRQHLLIIPINCRDLSSFQGLRIIDNWSVWHIRSGHERARLDGMSQTRARNKANYGVFEGAWLCFSACIPDTL